MQRGLCLKMALGCTCLERLAALFSQYDSDSSGVLDMPELQACLESLGIAEPLELAAAFDVNNDGSCEYIEFAAACLPVLEEVFDEMIMTEFDALDLYRRGFISHSEMLPLVESLKQFAEADSINIGDVDTNGDGQISFEEFSLYFGRPGAKILPRSPPSGHGDGLRHGKSCRQVAAVDLPPKSAKSPGARKPNSRARSRDPDLSSSSSSSGDSEGEDSSPSPSSSVRDSPRVARRRAPPRPSRESMKQLSECPSPGSSRGNFSEDTRIPGDSHAVLTYTALTEEEVEKVDKERTQEDEEQRHQEHQQDGAASLPPLPDGNALVLDFPAVQPTRWPFRRSYGDTFSGYNRRQSRIVAL